MIPPMKNVNIFGAQSDWRKCFKKSFDQKFEYFLAKLIGGNVQVISPIKSLNIFGAQIDWRKCFEKSSNQKFEYLL